MKLTTTTGKTKRGKMFGKPLLLKQKSKGNVKSNYETIPDR